MLSDVGTTDRFFRLPEREVGEISGVRDTLVDDAPSGLLAIPPRPTRRLGSVIADRYRLDRLLGAGAAGAVFEALDVDTGRRVALKVLHDRHAANRELVARFLREARIAQSLAHPGVVKISETGRDHAGRCFMVMELLEGMDLATAMEHGLLSTAHIVEVGRQILSVLVAAHAQGIVHRDVKPENIFLCKDARGYLSVKLLDFGVAKLTSAGRSFDTMQGLALGTPYYMSPEAARGDAPGPAADLWSLGAVLYHALAGVAPHDDDQLGRLLEKIVSVPIVTLAKHRSDVEPALVAIIDRALERDRQKRWRTAAEMLVALDALDD